MPRDVLITPELGIVDFFGVNSVSSATIILDTNGNLSISNAGGNLNIGDANRNVYIGDGINNIDVIFEQNGAIRALSGRTLTLGQSDSFISSPSVNTILNTTQATSTSTGALQVRGGVGIGGNLWVGGTINGNITGSVTGASSQVQTTAQTGNASYFPVFVDTNNASATAESLFTTSSFVINPSTSRVGIGTASPTYRLQVEGTVYAGGKLTVNPGTDVFTIAGNGAATPANVMAYIAASATTAIPLEVMAHTGGSQSADIFRVSSASGNGDFLVVKSNGSVGIGTISPNVRFEVLSNPGVARISGSSGTAPRLELSSAGVVNWSLRSNANSASDFTIFQDSTERIRITSGGNVGIGTTSPGARLDVRPDVLPGNHTARTITLLSDIYNNGSNGHQLAITSLSNNIHYQGWNISSNWGGRLSFGVFTTTFTTSTFEFLSIINGGNVGIGTTSPSARLEVAGTTRITGITTIADSTQASSTITGALVVTGGAGIGGNLHVGGTITGNFTGAASQVQTTAQTANASYFLTFVDTNNASATSESLFTTSTFLINPSTGRVGLGGTPSARLHIQGTAADDIVFDADHTNFNGRNARFPGRVVIGPAGGGYPGIYYNAVPTNAGGWNYLGSDTAWRIDLGNSNRMTLSYAPTGSSGSAITWANLLVANSSTNIGIGTDNPGAKLDVNGTIRNAAGIKTYSTTTIDQGNVNSTFELMRISRDTVNWSAQLGYEITVYNSYFRGGVTKWFISYNQVDSGTVICTYSAGTHMHRVYLGAEVLVSGTINYRPVLINIPNYQTVSVEVRYRNADVTTITNSGQVQFVGAMTTGTGSNYGGDTHIVPSGGNLGVGTLSPLSRLHVEGSARVTGITTVTNTTQSSSTTTGALQVVGGAGIGGNLNIGGTLNVSGLITGTANRAIRLSDETGILRIANPGGAAHTTGLATVTGAIKIKLPTAAFKSNTMMRMTVRIYEYIGGNAGTSRSLEVGGYNFNEAAANWYNIFATQSSMNAGDINVRFGNDGTSNCIWIANTTTNWSYPQVAVTDFQGGHSNFTDAIWGTGWNISFTTTFDTVTQGPIIAAQPLNSGNFNSYAPTLTGTGASGTWGINISGSSGSTTNATNVGVTNDTSNAATHYITFVSTSTGNLPIKVDNAELVFVPSTGRLGIGTTSPVAKLQSSGAAQTTTPTGGSAAGSGFYITNTDPNYGMMFGVASNGNGWIQQQRSDGSNTQYKLSLNPLGGEVGIGTSSPLYRLQVNGVEVPMAAVGSGPGYVQGAIVSSSGTDNSPQTRGQGMYLFNEGNDTTWYVGTNYTAADTFSINRKGSTTNLDTSAAQLTQAFLTVLNSGNVGIGTSSPGTKLEVSAGYVTAGTATSTNGSKILGGSYSNGHLTTFGSAFSSGGPIIGYGVWPSTSAEGSFVSSTGINVARGAYAISGNIHVWYGGGAQTVAVDGAITTSEFMRLNASGNLGIGTNNPQVRLDVVSASGNSANPTIVASNGTSNLRFLVSCGAGNWNPLVQAGDQALIFSAGTENTGNLVIGQWSSSSRGMRIDSSGNITVGGTITTPNNAVGIIVGDDSRFADRNVANTVFLEGTQNNDRGYINFSTTTGNALGAINAGDLTWRGNAVLHAANYNSYSPTLTGGGASGTWNITVNGCTFPNDSAGKDNITTRTDSGFYETSSGTTAEGWPLNDNTFQHLISCTHSNDVNYFAMQIAASYYSQNWYFRNTGGSGTTAWSTMLHSGNYTSYSPSLTGTGASGTWGISITGNAATVGGVAETTFLRRSIDTWNTSAEGTARFWFANSGRTYFRSGDGFEWRSSGDGNIAVLTNGGAFNAVGAITQNGNQVLHASNYTSYSPSLTGSGASGNWNIRAYPRTGSGASINFNWVGQSGQPTWLWGGNAEADSYVYNPSNFSVATCGGFSSFAWSYVAGSPYYTMGTPSNASNARVYETYQVVTAHAVPIGGGTFTGDVSFSRGSSPRIIIQSPSGDGRIYTNQTFLYLGGGDSIPVRISSSELYVSGTIFATSNITAYSDERVKANWANLPNNFVEKLSQVKSGTYDRTDITLRQVGVSAQSLETILPEAIIRDEKDGKLSVAYGNAALASAVELAKRVVEQEKKIAQLEQIINTILSKIS